MVSRTLRIAATIATVAWAASATADHHHHDRDSVSTAAGSAGAPAEPATPPGPDDAKALAILQRLASASDRAARTAANADLDAIAPRAVDAIGSFVVRAHTTTVDDRRKVLIGIKAATPNKAGQFVQPERKSEKEDQADDDFDWLAALMDKDASDPAVGEVIADDAAIRALASTHDVHAAQLIFNAAFAPETMIYRDECGRYLRKMEAAAIPALTIEQLKGKDYDRTRYATYQLERMDRQEPGKALAAAAGDEALTIAVLDAFRTTHHREAVHAVWTKVDADAPRVRAAARAAWLGYVTGPPPPPAPTKKLVLPGGKLAPKPTPLWLTYRELAENELRKAAMDTLKEDDPAPDPEHGIKGVAIDVDDMTKRIFAFYDAQRASRETAQWAAAQAKAKAGDIAGAASAIDALLAENPDRDEKAAMAQIYFLEAKDLEAKQSWADAASAYSKAAGLDPASANATTALAAHFYTQGMALKAAGKDPGPDLRRAAALKPDYAPVKAAATTADVDLGHGHHARPLWMLYAAGVAGLFALALFAIGLARRRA